MPVYIGDYLADTMHLSTEQHGAYLLLLFHLWRRGILHDKDAVLAKISGLSLDAWSIHRAVLEEFFQIRDGHWHHGRVERERARIASKSQSNSLKSRAAANSRWAKTPLEHASSIASSIAPSIAWGMRGDAKSQSESESESESQFASLRFSKGEPRCVDARHSLFRKILSEYWTAKNSAAPEMPWQGRDAKALSDFLSASPKLDERQFRQMLGNRARSAVAHGDRVYLWIANLTRYQEEITVYNKPVSAGGASASRAEINRNSVVSAVDRALAMAREHAGGVGEAGAEPAVVDYAGVLAADGTGSGGFAFGVPGGGDYRVETGDSADGETGTDGSVSYGSAVEGASGVVEVGGLVRG